MSLNILIENQEINYVSAGLILTEPVHNNQEDIALIRNNITP